MVMVIIDFCVYAMASATRVLCGGAHKTRHREDFVIGRFLAGSAGSPGRQKCNFINVKYAPPIGPF